MTSLSKSIFRKKSLPWLVLWALACAALALFADALGIAHLRDWIVGAFFVGEVLIYGALDKAKAERQSLAVLALRAFVIIMTERS